MVPELTRSKDLRNKLAALSELIWETQSQLRLMHIYVKETVLTNALLINALRESDIAFINRGLPVQVRKSHMAFRTHLIALSEERIKNLANYINEMRVK